MLLEKLGEGKAFAFNLFGFYVCFDILQLLQFLNHSSIFPEGYYGIGFFPFLSVRNLAAMITNLQHLY